MKTVIIEDNPAARRNLKSLVQEHCFDVQIIGEASSVEEGAILIASSAPDLVFLDIEISGGTSFDLLQQLPEINFQIIFTTAHEKYAIKAIKFSALDYLLKPIDIDELESAVEKARAAIGNNSTPQKIETLIQNINAPSTDPLKLVLKDKYGIQIVPVNDIIRLEANGNYTKFVISGQEDLLISKGLKDYDNMLVSESFFRCHQSHLINLNYLLRYDKREGDFLLLKEGNKVPLANRKKDKLLQVINGK